MPVYDVAIRKEFTAVVGITPWSNIYHVNAANEEAALDVGEDIANLEAAVLYDVILITRLNARQSSIIAGSGRQRSVSIQGTRSSTGKQFLPLFNAVRVTFTDGINRPDQKYLRLPLAEDEQNSGAIDSGLLALIGLDYAQPLLGVPGVVSSDDAPYTAQLVQPNVQMRQRSWSRRSRPGFKRGYVPV